MSPSTKTAPRYATAQPRKSSQAYATWPLASSTPVAEPRSHPASDGSHETPPEPSTSSPNRHDLSKSVWLTRASLQGRVCGFKGVSGLTRWAVGSAGRVP
jgi:hypothetical protein